MPESFSRAVPRIEPMAAESPLAGFRTLLYKEVLRFWKVSFQTVGAPVLNALLFLLIFSHVLDRHVTVYGEVAYTSFLVPGLVMMSVLQNAFANSSSSLIQSKITGNIIFVLLPPLSYREFYAAYVIASTLRGLMVGAGVLAVSAAFVEVPMAHPLWVLGFAVLSAQHIISYLIRFKYLPFFISVFSNHGFSEDAGLPSVGFSCAYFCLLAAIIVACILRAVRHVDLKITVGTRI